MMSKYGKLLKQSYKSADTEEWLDIVFTRRVGLVIALVCRRIGITPNNVTVFSIVLGVLAAFMFAHVELKYNIAGVLLLMCANFCDSADGQLARLTNNHSSLGRILDGLAGDIWFICIYTALCFRITMSGNTDWILGIGCWLLGAVAGICCHSVQSAQADYYRQIHLAMLKPNRDNELYVSENRKTSENSDVKWYVNLFNSGYARYSKAQQRRAPICHKYLSFSLRCYKHFDCVPDVERAAFLAGSRPLMKYTNILTFNTRAICLYVTCLLNMPVLYFVFEIIVLHPLYLYMRYRHEKLCRHQLETYSCERS